MSDTQSAVDALVDHLFRHEAGKLAAILTRIFGPAHIELAEDIVQDTLLAALDHWAVGEIPDNPAAWLTQVAKRKALNEIQRRKTARKYTTLAAGADEGRYAAVEEAFLDSEIRDSQLRMIFTCCHPSLALESQIALTLKTLCGFGVHEIARALLSNDPTINKRLYRARQKLRSRLIPFDIPTGPAAEERLSAVCLTLYLMFNEGYNSAARETIIRRDLCAEALRLTRLLTERFDAYPDLWALMALMCFHIARFEARLDKRGAIVIFEDQDRRLWDRRLIATGMRCLGKASSGDRLSTYHLEAGIAAEHCMARSFADTDWQSVYRQYELLYQINNNPIVKLNMAIVCSQTEGAAAAIDRLEEMAADSDLHEYYLLPATLGVLYLQTGEYRRARQNFTKARSMTKSRQAIDFIEKKLDECPA